MKCYQYVSLSNIQLDLVFAVLATSTVELRMQGCQIGPLQNSQYSVPHFDFFDELVFEFCLEPASKFKFFKTVHIATLSKRRRFFFFNKFMDYISGVFFRPFTTLLVYSKSYPISVHHLCHSVPFLRTWSYWLDLTLLSKSSSCLN